MTNTITFTNEYNKKPISNLKFYQEHQHSSSHFQSEILLFPRFQKSQKRNNKIVGFSGNKEENNFQDQKQQQQPLLSLQSTRRAAALSLGCIALVGSTTCNGASLAEDNGYWITGPLPIPPVYNSKLPILL